MRGPRFVSFLASDSYYCGGAYPNDGLQSALVYDLTTGAPVNWLKLLPPTVQSVASTAADGTSVGLVTWPAVLDRARQHANPDCKDVFASDAEVSFALSLNARAGTLDALPVDLAHAVQGCGDTVSLPIATLRRLGVAPALVDALEQAKRMQ